MANIARLGVVLGIDSAEFTAGIAAAKKTVSELADKLKIASTIAVGAFSAMAYKAMEYADRMQDTAKANDVGIASVLQLSRALQQNGGESENAGKLLSSFTSHIDQAAQGSKTAQDAFKRVGVSLKDLASMSNEELMKKTLEGLNAMPDVVGRNAVAMTAFGKAAKNVDFKGMLDDMQQVNPEFEAHAKAVEMAGNMHDRLQKRADQLTLTFVQGVFPAMNDIVSVFDDLGKGADGSDAKIKLLDTTLRRIAAVALGAGAAVVGLGKILGGLSAMVVEVFSGDWIHGKSNFKGIFDAMVDDLKTSTLAVADEMDKIINGQIDKTVEKKSVKVKRSVTVGVDTKTEKADREAERQAEELRLAKLISSEYDSQENTKLKLMQSSGQMLYMTKDQQKVAQALLQIDTERDKKLDEINKKLEKEQAKPNVSRSQAVIDQLEKQKTLVNEVADKYRKLTYDELASQQVLQNSFKFGWTNAFNQFLEDAQNDSKLASDMFSSMTNNMNSFLDNFVKTGKLNFGDFAKSVIQDLIAIQLKMSAMKMIAAFSGGGYGDTAGVAAGVPQFANGGTISAGSPVIVGERGPELFFPSRSGAVIPTNDMASIGGGGGDTYNGTVIQSMSAIDTQSAMQFIASNKNAIFSANQSAARSMPTSR